MTDWRLQGQEKYLYGKTLYFKKYKKYSKEWEHDHCEFCSAKFSEENKDDLKYGYSASDDYHWICENCCNDFVDKFNWKIVK